MVLSHAPTAIDSIECSLNLLPEQRLSYHSFVTVTRHGRPVKLVISPHVETVKERCLTFAEFGQWRLLFFIFCSLDVIKSKGGKLSEWWHKQCVCLLLRKLWSLACQADYNTNVILKAKSVSLISCSASCTVRPHVLKLVLVEAARGLVSDIHWFLLDQSHSDSVQDSTHTHSPHLESIYMQCCLQ